VFSAGATIEAIKTRAADVYPGEIDSYIIEWIWKQLKNRPELSFVVFKVRHGHHSDRESRS
jgi:hypothetical protein